MPSFDTVCEANLVDVKNGVENTTKEIGTRFDFKGTAAAIEIKDKEITLIGDAEFQLDQIEDVLRNKLTKRNVDVRFLDKGDVQKMGGDKVKCVIKVRNGIESELGKKIQRLIKDSKLKVQAAIQGDSVRVTGVKRDDLQAAMALLKKEITDIPLSFNNFRDSKLASGFCFRAQSGFGTVHQTAQIGCMAPNQQAAHDGQGQRNTVVRAPGHTVTEQVIHRRKNGRHHRGQ